jgi:Ca2+-binding EF-hand superfamily protein
VLDRHLPLAALIALGAATPAFAAAVQAPKPRAAAPAAAQAMPTRAAVIQNLEGTFKAVDLNGDGVLSQQELATAEAKSVQQRLAIFHARVAAEFARLDTNKDGQLSSAEFMAAAPAPPSTPATGAGILAQLDKNKDGKISVDEYRAPILARFDSIDTNRDGTISQAERAAAEAKAAKR